MTAIVLAMLGGVVLAEVGLRLSGFGAASRTVDDRYVVWNDSLTLYRPHARYEYSREHPRLVQLNNLGFHDVDRTPASSRYRYVVIGDRIVTGDDVEMDSVFTRHADRRLDGAEVLNGGLSGSGTATQYLLWRDYLDGRIDFDHLVLSFYTWNDLENNHPALQEHFYGRGSPSPAVRPDGSVYLYRPPSTPLPLRTRVAVRLSSYSALVNTAYTGLYRIKEAILDGAPRDVYVTREEDETSWAAWTETSLGTLRLLDRWQNELALRGIPFSIMVVDGGGDIHNGLYTRGSEAKHAFMAELKEWADREGVRLLTFDFTGFSAFDLYSTDGETLRHFNHLGHRIVGEQLAPWLAGDDRRQGNRLLKSETPRTSIVRR